MSYVIFIHILDHIPIYSRRPEFSIINSDQRRDDMAQNEEDTIAKKMKLEDGEELRTLHSLYLSFFYFFFHLFLLISSSL